MADEAFHRKMLARAIDNSKQAVTEPALYEPFGAVVVRDSDKTILGEGCNNMREQCDPTLHGEVVAIKRACKEAGSLTLNGCTLYTSCEPCAMCASLIWLTTIDRVFYANKASQTWDLFDVRAQYQQVATPASERPNYSQMMGGEAEEVLRQWAQVAPQDEGNLAGDRAVKK